MIKNNSIEEIKTNGYCAGCGLCVSVAEKSHIKMQINASGYLRPVAKQVLSSEIEKSINEVCPGVHIQHPAGFEKLSYYMGAVS